MFAAVAKSIFGSANDRYVRSLGKYVDAINGLEPNISALSDDELKHQTELFRQRLANGEKLDNLLPDALATVREAAIRTLGQRHYDVQLIGGTLTDEERREAYNSDITYGTNNELGFDYLRDNMKYSRSQMVQRPFNFAIVDEVDSILIDEARTPLIISGPTDDKSDLYISADKIVKTLLPSDYDKDEKQKSVVLTEDGTEKAERMLEEAGLIEGRNLYDLVNTQEDHHWHQALKANVMYTKD